jgi:hypothetical protein
MPGYMYLNRRYGESNSNTVSKRFRKYFVFEQLHYDVLSDYETAFYSTAFYESLTAVQRGQVNVGP